MTLEINFGNEEEQPLYGPPKPEIYIPEMFVDNPPKDLADFTLKEIDPAIDTLHEDINKATELAGRIQDEMSALQKKLDEMRHIRQEVNGKISRSKNWAENLASKRERLRQEQMADQAIAETAEKIMEILADFPTWDKLFDYQKEDVTAAIHAFLSGYSGFLNANDMGMGKTLESIVIVKILTTLLEADLGRKPRLLWITKSSILKTGGTVREFDHWNPDFKIAPLDGSINKKDRDAFFNLINMIPGMAVITNYETCRTTEALKDVEWDIIVFDEVHKLKGGANLSGPTGIWKACKEVATMPSVRMLLMLTGTPMVNRPAEMWAYLHIFDEDRFPSLRKFESEYTMITRFGYENKIEIDAQKLLQTALKGRMIRRTKKEVGLQLPPITPYEQRARMLTRNPEQDKVYCQMRDRFFIWLEDQDEDATFSTTALIAQLIRLRQINVWPVVTFKDKDEDGNIIGERVMEVRDSSKIDEVMEDIENIGEEQFVLFCTFNAPLYEVQRRCKEELGITCEVLSGASSDNMKDLEIGFQQGTIQVLCLNSSMGEVLNLQKNPERWPGGSSYVGFLDLWYNPARNDQCTDRIYRPGAPEPVTVIHYKNEESVDQWLDMIIEEKYQSITGISEDKALRPSEWKQLLKGKI